jgi:microsomal dipeptidase-like Zn-dependent dipeptidase
VSRNLDDEQLLALRDNGGVVQTVAFSSYVDPVKNRAHQQAVSALQDEIAEGMGFVVLGRQERFALAAAEREAYEAQLRELQAMVDARMDEVNAVAPPVDVADFVDHIDYLVDHIDYLVDLIGIEHVVISSNFDGGVGVEGWGDASETFNFTLELVRRGYSEDESAMMWSGNRCGCWTRCSVLRRRSRQGAEGASRTHWLRRRVEGASGGSPAPLRRKPARVGPYIFPA